MPGAASQAPPQTTCAAAAQGSDPFAGAPADTEADAATFDPDATARRAAESGSTAAAVPAAAATAAAAIATSQASQAAAPASGLSSWLCT